MSSRLAKEFIEMPLDEIEGVAREPRGTRERALDEQASRKRISEQRRKELVELYLRRPDERRGGRAALRLGGAIGSRSPPTARPGRSPERAVTGRRRTLPAAYPRGRDELLAGGSGLARHLAERVAAAGEVHLGPVLVANHSGRADLATSEFGCDGDAGVAATAAREVLVGTHSGARRWKRPTVNATVRPFELTEAGAVLGIRQYLS